MYDEVLRVLRQAEAEGWPTAKTAHWIVRATTEIEHAGTGAVSKKHPATSRKAARNITPSIKNQQGRILFFIEEKGSATDFEIRDGVPMLASSVRPRRGELEKHKYVAWNGETRRSLDSDEDANVYVLTPKGRGRIQWMRRTRP